MPPSMQPKEITALQDVILALHGCEAKYRRTEHIKEMCDDAVAWEGFVRVFKLAEHPEAKRCYAWSYAEGEETKHVTVLEIPPVDSAQSAVKTAIAATARPLPGQ